MGDELQRQAVAAARAWAEMDNPHELESSEERQQACDSPGRLRRGLWMLSGRLWNLPGLDDDAIEQAAKAWEHEVAGSGFYNANLFGFDEIVERLHDAINSRRRNGGGFDWDRIERQAQAAAIPPELKDLYQRTPAYCNVAMICRELQRHHQPEPFYLSGRKVATIMGRYDEDGHPDNSAGRLCLKALVRRKILEQVERGQARVKGVGGRTARWRYIGGPIADAATAADEIDSF